MQIDLAELREFITQRGPVRVARQAGLAKATLLGSAREDWNPQMSTILAVAAVMDRDAAKSQPKEDAA